MSELKNCPFCGNDEIQKYNYEPDKWRVTCRDCRNTTKDWPTLDEATERWNTRVDDPKLKLAVEALEHYANRFGNKVAAEALKQIGEQR